MFSSIQSVFTHFLNYSLYKAKYLTLCTLRVYPWFYKKNGAIKIL